MRRRDAKRLPGPEEGRRHLLRLIRGYALQLACCQMTAAVVRKLGRERPARELEEEILRWAYEGVMGTCAGLGYSQEEAAAIWEGVVEAADRLLERLTGINEQAVRSIFALGRIRGSAGP